MATTSTAEQIIAQERVDIWRAAAALTLEHRAGVLVLVPPTNEVAVALWHLAKSFEQRADAVTITTSADYHQALRRLASTIRTLYPCTCTRNKGLDTHPRTCPARGHAEDWLIAEELDKLAESVIDGEDKR